MKVIQYASLLAFAFLLAGCSTTAQHSKGEKHHHHQIECKDGKCEMKTKACDMKSCDMEDCQMYEKHCAHSVSQGDMNVKGSDDYKLKHDGHTYYFSSEEKMKEFEKELEPNIQKANENWHEFRGGVFR